MRVSTTVAATVSIGLTMAGAAHAIWNAPVEESPEVNLSQQGTQALSQIEQKCHDVSNIWLVVSNFGVFGLPEATAANEYEESCEGHEGFISCQFPARGGWDYLFQGALWVGAIVGDDTLVSVGHDGWQLEQEFFPGFDPGDTIIAVSNNPAAANYDSVLAKADQTFISVYTDTLLTSDDPNVSPNHRKPLNIRVQQTSHALSFNYAQDFVIFDYEIENLGLKTLKDVYIGLYLDGDVGPTPQNNSDASANAQDDITGFRALDAAGKVINTAWIADYDGPSYRNPNTGDAALAPGVMAVRVVRSPQKELKTTFNWWFSSTDQGLDWGPGRKFPDGLRGTPDGDVNKYLILSGWQNQNLGATYGDSLCVDPPYDPAVPFEGPCKIYRDPGQLGANKDGQPIAADDTRFLFSFGPFSVAPGERLPFTLGYFCAEGFWRGGNVSHPDYTDFDINASWVQFVFDNPATDTPTNDYGRDGLPNTGDAGENDGIPDTGDYFFGEDVGPDGVPGTFDRDPVSGALLEGNGELDSVLVDGVWKSEDRALAYVIEYIDADDPMEWMRTVGVNIDWSKQPDEIMAEFPEIHLSSEKRFGFGNRRLDEGDGEPDFAGPPPPPSPEIKIDKPDDRHLVVKWKDDPERFIDGFIPDPARRQDFQGYRVYTSRTGTGNDFTRVLDLDLDRVPLRDADGNIVYEGGEVVWMPDTLGRNTGFESIRNTDPDSTEYPYAYSFGPTPANWPLYLAVTSYDNGYPPANLASLESSVFNNVVRIAPTTPLDDAAKKPVRVVPNPYKITADYRDTGGHGGWEREPQSWTEFDRRIAFTNLPGKSTIRIFTLAGDLVDTVEFDPDHPDDTTAFWDLISKNGQAVVSGIYLYSVEPADGGKIEVGKFVIIK